MASNDWHNTAFGGLQTLFGQLEFLETLTAEAPSPSERDNRDNIARDNVTTTTAPQRATAVHVDMDSDVLGDGNGGGGRRVAETPSGRDNRDSGTAVNAKGSDNAFNDEDDESSSTLHDSSTSSSASRPRTKKRPPSQPLESKHTKKTAGRVDMDSDVVLGGGGGGGGEDSSTTAAATVMMKERPTAPSLLANSTAMTHFSGQELLVDEGLAVLAVPGDSAITMTGLMDDGAQMHSIEPHGLSTYLDSDWTKTPVLAGVFDTGAVAAAASMMREAAAHANRTGAPTVAASIMMPNGTVSLANETGAPALAGGMMLKLPLAALLSAALTNGADKVALQTELASLRKQLEEAARQNNEASALRKQLEENLAEEQRKNAALLEELETKENATYYDGCIVHNVTNAAGGTVNVNHNGPSKEDIAAIVGTIVEEKLRAALQPAAQD